MLEILHTWPEGVGYLGCMPKDRFSLLGPVLIESTYLCFTWNRDSFVDSNAAFPMA